MCIEEVLKDISEAEKQWTKAGGGEGSIRREESQREGCVGGQIGTYKEDSNVVWALNEDRAEIQGNMAFKSGGEELERRGSKVL